MMRLLIIYVYYEFFVIYYSFKYVVVVMKRKIYDKNLYVVKYGLIVSKLFLIKGVKEL